MVTPGYTALSSDVDEKVMNLGLGAGHTDIGSVQLIRDGSNLLLAITTDSPYTMDQVHLYVDNTAPADRSSGLFQYKYKVSDPADYFTAYTFC